MSPRIVNVIAMIPPPPTPCTPRARINCSIDCAKPANTEPSRKMAMVTWSITLRP